MPNCQRHFLITQLYNGYGISTLSSRHSIYRIPRPPASAYNDHPRISDSVSAYYSNLTQIIDRELGIEQQSNCYAELEYYCASYPLSDFQSTDYPLLLTVKYVRSTCRKLHTTFLWGFGIRIVMEFQYSRLKRLQESLAGKAEDILALCSKLYGLATVVLDLQKAFGGMAVCSTPY